MSPCPARSRARIALFALTSFALSLVSSHAPAAGSPTRVPQADLAASRAAVQRYLAKHATLDFGRGLHVHADLPLLWEHHDLHGGGVGLLLASSRGDELHLEGEGLTSRLHGEVHTLAQLSRFRVKDWSHLDRIVAKAVLKLAGVRGTVRNEEARARARDVLRTQTRAARELDALLDEEVAHPGLALLLDVQRARHKQGDVATVEFTLAESGTEWLAVRDYAGRPTLVAGRQGNHMTRPATRTDLARFQIATLADLDRAVERALAMLAPEDLE